MTTETRADRVDLARAEAFLATVGTAREVAVGHALPPMAHLAFFWDIVDEAGLGRDGHPRLGGLIPDLGLPVRMWAGGRLAWHQPFVAGVQAERLSSVTSVQRKEGRSGKLAFVTVRHEVKQARKPVVSEDQTIVYRESGALAGDPPVEPGEADERRALKLTAVTLFRYSALTFNAHRIHYDEAYCRDEGYAGVVVHGPLMATYLAAFAEEALGGLQSFEFRATAPLYLGDVAWLCRAGRRFWVEGPRRRLCLDAVAT